MIVEKSTASSLRHGRRHELRVLGVTMHVPEGAKYQAPQYLHLRPSLREVINSKIESAGEIYDPANPNWGRSGELFSAVKKHLPSYRPNFFKLYISILTSLDHYHGVDAFFLWEGVYFTIDLSTNDQDEIKADISVCPEDMEPNYLDMLGRIIASVLVDRRNEYPTSRRIRM